MMDMTTTAASATQPKLQPPTSHRNRLAAESTSPVITVLAITTITYLGETRRQSPTARSIRGDMDVLRTLVVVAGGEGAEQLGEESRREEDHRSDGRQRGQQDGVAAGQNIPGQEVGEHTDTGTDEKRAA